MKKILYIIFTICLIGIFSNTVKADEWDDDASGDDSSTSYSGGCKGTDSCWYDQYFGFRISLIDKDGNRIVAPDGKITNSADYWNSIPTGNVYSVRATPNRFEVLLGTVADTFASGATTAYKISIQDYYSNSSGNYIVNYFNDILNKPENESIEVKFLESMGLNKEEVKKLCNQRMLLLVEPLFSVAKSNGKIYTGTGTEIARLMYRESGFGHAKSISYKGTIPKAIMTPNNIASIPSLIPVSNFTKGSTGPDINKLLYVSGNKIYGYAMGIWDYSASLDCPSGCEATPNDLPKCCDLPQNRNKIPECCGLEENKNKIGCKPDLCTFFDTSENFISITNDCKEGTKSYIRDTEKWECIFESRNSTVANIKNHFYEWENRYCSVFCRESIVYEFPDNNMNVFAGRRFTLGYTGFSPTLGPIAFTGRSECRINSSTGAIRWDLFKTDWANANTAVKIAWDNYQIEVKKDDSIANYKQSSTYDCASYCDHNDHGVKCCKSATRDCDDCYYGDPKECVKKWIPGKWENGIYIPGKYDPCATTKDTCRYGCSTYYCKSGQRDTAYYHGKTRTPTEQTYINTDNVTLKINTNSWCTSCGNSFTSTKCTPDTTYTASRRNTYNSAVNTRDGYLRTLKECNNFQRTYNEFRPVTFFQYEEEYYGGEIYRLSDNLEIRAQTNYFSGATLNTEHKWNTSSYVGNSNKFIYSYDVYGKNDVIAKWVCDTLRQKCYSTNETYPTNDWIKSFTTKEFDYVLPNNVYRFVDKPSGFSYHVPQNENSYDLGFSSLPIHYSRAPGVYDFSIDYKTFGPNHKFNKFIFDGAYVNISYGEDLSIYSFLWNNTTLNRLINDCEQGGHHLGHSFVSQIGSRLGEFLASGCANTYGCVMSGSSKVQCNKYQDTNGVWRTASGNSYYSVYNQLRACVQSKVVSTTGSIAFNEDTKYECEYNVRNRVMCPPGSCDEQVGLSVIYRNINLSDPFPGLSGTGRKPGNNWSVSYYINTYITNNRGVTTDRVYFDRDPLYKITLTPAVIKSIRQYNRRQTQLDEGYADFKMRCLLNGEKCLSGFIRESSFTNLFSGCGISGKQINPSRCASNEAW